MVTIKDVAAMANVSTATVSRAINSPELVSDERREAVQRAIAALNYHPNDIARSLQKSESYIVGVLVPDITNIFTPTSFPPSGRSFSSTATPCS